MSFLLRQGFRGFDHEEWDKATRLHEDATIIDGLIVLKWGPDIFAAMRAIAIWKGWFREHAALIRQVRDVADIAAAKRERRTGIILGISTPAPPSAVTGRALAADGGYLAR